MVTPRPVEFVTASMSPADAETIAAWHYDGPWATYDLNGQAPAELDAYGSVWVHTGTGSELVGFFCVGAHARVPGLDAVDGTLDLGWGMHPDWVGQGHGPSFGTAVLAAVHRRNSSGTVRAVVQSWNQRSIRLLETLGFAKSGTHLFGQGGRHVQYDMMTCEMRCPQDEVID